MTTRPKGALCDKDLKNGPRVSGFLIRDLTGASNNEGDGYENVTEKVNLFCLKPCLAYSMSNDGNCFWS